MAVYSNEIQVLLNRIDELQVQVEAMRPIKPELINRILQKFRLEWNYNSNSIEGNSLNYGETVAFIMEGLTAKGKPLKDHLDIKGHNDAINFLLDMQKEGTELMERDIRSMHEMILVEPYQSKAQTSDGQATTKTIQLGVYKSSPNHVVTKTGETHYYASPEETPALMQELMAWYRENKPIMHPLVLSTLFHHRFVNIHPFDDGNGRMSRLLSNLILMQAGFPPVVVRQDQKSEYYGVLSQADAGVTDPLLDYFANLLIHSLELYLKGARGEDISEPSDFDKEIALFVSSFDEDELNKVALSEEVLADTYSMVFETFLNELRKPTSEISKLFFDTTLNLHTEIINGSIVKDVTDYIPVQLNSFIQEWGNDLVKTVLVEKYEKKSLRDSEILRLKINLRYNGFKVNDKVGSISGIFIFDFARAYYSVAAIEPGRNEVRKSYPRKMSNLEARSIVQDFFRELMTVIKSKSIV